MKKQIVYVPVEIKSQNDLPKKDGYYFVNVGDKYDIPEDVFRWENGNDRIKRDWLDIDWYLQPVEMPTEEEKNRAGYDYSGLIKGDRMIAYQGFLAGFNWLKKELNIE